MHYAHTDFLSYEDIDTEVDRIFKAFCDTALIEFAKGREKNMQRYWSEVRNFRRENLCPFERPDLAKKAAAEPHAKDVSDEDFAYARSFVYWFDVRADYWSRHDADQKLLDSLVPSSELASLFKKARSVQARVHNAEQVAEAVRWGYWDGNGNVIESDRPPPAPSPRRRS